MTQAMGDECVGYVGEGWSFRHSWHLGDPFHIRPLSLSTLCTFLFPLTFIYQSLAFYHFFTFHSLPIHPLSRFLTVILLRFLPNSFLLHFLTFSLVILAFLCISALLPDRFESFRPK
jgi:hypothetical protein